MAGAMSACHCSMGAQWVDGVKIEMPHEREDHVRRIEEKKGFGSAEEAADAGMKAHKLCHALGRKKPHFRSECDLCMAAGDDDDE